MVGVRLNRPAHALFWYLLALANLSFSAGEVVQVVQTQFLHLDNPFPSVADGFYLAEFVLYAAGVLGFIRWRTARQDRAGLLDALILTMGLALLAWIYLILPYALNPDLGWFQKAVSIAYPLGDVVVLALLLRLLTPRGGNSRSLQLLAVGTVGILVSDTLYGLIQLHGGWHIGTGVDLGWAAFYTAWGAAALHPSMVELTRPVPTQQPDLSAGRLVLLTLASLIAPAILIIESLNGNTRNAGVIGTFSALLYLLVLARLAVVVVARRQAIARERALREAGARLTAALSVEEVADAVQAAASTLMPTEPGHVALLAVTEAGVLHVRHAERGAAQHLLGPAADSGQALALAAYRETRLLPIEDIGSDLATRLDGMPSALLCPLTLDERPSGDPLIGALIVTGTAQELTSLWGSLEILAGQAALAVERVVLSQEVNRRNSELYFRTLVQNASDVILILDADDSVRYASSSAERVLGHPSLDGTLLTDLVPPEDSRAVGKALARMRGPAEPSGGPAVTRTAPRALAAAAAGPDPDRGRGALQRPARRPDRRRPGAHPARRDRAAPDGARTHPPGLPRLPHRPRQPGAVPGPGRPRAVPRQRSGAVTGVLFLDLDDFKVVNDTQGHAVGDELLVAVSLRISTALRSSDTAARLGGDEFAVLVEDALLPADVDAIADTVLTVFAEPFKLSAGAVRVAASIGVATTEDSVDATELLTHADLALYSAKAAGRRQWHHYQPPCRPGWWNGTS